MERLYARLVLWLAGASPVAADTQTVGRTGASPDGANSLGDCGRVKTVKVGPEITGGRGHARVATTRAGVNGLFDMGANVWEWTENGGERETGMRGGSWWYGAAQMRADAVYTKPRDFPAAYIGFRCVRDRP